MRISAILVTKGDRDISHILGSMKDFDEVIVWNNKCAPKDVKVFGRYAGAMLARNDDVYIQDDDSIVPWSTMQISYELRANLKDICLCNFPHHRRAEYEGSGIALLGWGTMFRRHMLRAFDEYLSVYPADELFYRECDRVFSYLVRSSIHLVDVNVQQLEYAFGEDRMGKEPRHREDFIEIKRRLATLK